MIVNELFDQAPVEIEQLSTDEANFFGSNFAYKFKVNNSSFVVYFQKYVNCNDDEYNFGFGKIAAYDSYDIDHDLTGAGVSPLKIFNAVFECLNRFIYTYSPDVVQFSGFVTRQDAFYNKLVRYLEKRNTEYSVSKEAGSFFLTKNRGSLTENAILDIAKTKKAEELATVFIDYVSKHGLKNLHAHVDDHYKHTVYFAEPSLLGLPEEYKDLFMGVVMQSTTKILGYSMEKNSNIGPVYFTVVIANEHGRFKPSVLVHEIIHYFDRVDHAKNNTSFDKGYVTNATDFAGYMNTPQEFNAYFHMGFYNTLYFMRTTDSKMVSKILKSYNSFYDYMVPKFFERDFIGNLTEENLKRFRARLYKIWVYLKKHYETDGALDMPFPVPENWKVPSGWKSVLGLPAAAGKYLGKLFRKGSQ